jgi:alpha-beta hydrolase superfamily lysophospholipase
VWAYDVATGERSLAYSADWDVTSYRFSEDGRRLVVAINADARTKLALFDTTSGREIALPALPDGDLGGVAFERGGDRIAFYVNGDASPANLHVLDVATGALRSCAGLELAIAPAISRRAQHPLPELRRARDPALLYPPREASPSHRVPALVYVHGGPGGQCRTGYNPIIQHLVNHGYAVLAINNRGSSGYGKTFFHMDDRAHGDVDLKDCVYARRYLESLDGVDGKRVGIIGGSYGGYLVCAALAFEPDAFDVGIDIFGVTNWMRTLASIPAWWAEFRDSLYAEIGDPATDKERLEARSPLLHAANIRKPLLVIQGKNDPRVLEAESREIAAASRRTACRRVHRVPRRRSRLPRQGNRIRASTRSWRSSTGIAPAKGSPVPAPRGAGFIAPKLGAAEDPVEMSGSWLLASFFVGTVGMGIFIYGKTTRAPADRGHRADRLVARRQPVWMSACARGGRRALVRDEERLLSSRGAVAQCTARRRLEHRDLGRRLLLPRTRPSPCTRRPARSSCGRRPVAVRQVAARRHEVPDDAVQSRRRRSRRAGGRRSPRR